MKKFIYKKKPNTKGFNLFSSVVAAVLIMSGVVLVNILISTEEKTSNQIYLMVNSFRLNDAASLARADSLQNFNYYFRDSMENWLAIDKTRLNDYGGHPLINKNNYNNWDLMVRNFEKVILLKDTGGNTAIGFDAAINAVAKNTVEKFRESYYGRYHITLKDEERTAIENIKFVIKEALQESTNDNESFFEVIECDLEECEGGSFYFNIPLDKISDESYEKLPRIIVKDTVTNEEIRTPILPKSRLRIYVPLRIFKALHLSMKRADEIFTNADSDLSEAQLGFCDDGCVPRKNPVEELEGSWTKNCPTDTTDNITQELHLPMQLGNYANNYIVGGSQFGQLPLNYFSISKICSISLPETDNQEVFSDFYNYQTEPNNGLLTINGRVENCPYQKINAIVGIYSTKEIAGSAEKMYCSKIQNVQIDLTYRETNKNYIMKGEELFHKIRIVTGPYDIPGDIQNPPKCNSGGGGNYCKPQ
ncbi:MAG: hypothetical protein GX950_03485 [Candidatus Diapherotrites archaeon]|uniref:Uncharacterized protein n=1 Tax=Candidatus Iainarchaeum sp. TaxID=3101447 RepID=A0A7K4C015_9ARCH|nr:hypothetical protein [Candidatus Diapherotrites archaeon]